MANANVTGGKVGGSVSSIKTNANVTGGKVGDVVSKQKKTADSAFILPGLPVEQQIHLTDAQKQEAAIMRGYDSPAEELSYQKNNPSLYMATGGKKYMENGYNALANPQSVVSPDTLTAAGKSVIKAAQDADAGKTPYDNYTIAQIDKAISAKWHRSQNDEETAKEVNYLKATKEAKEKGFTNLIQYGQYAKEHPVLSGELDGKNYDALSDEEKKKYAWVKRLDDIYNMPAGSEKNKELSDLKAELEKAKKDYENSKKGIIGKAVNFPLEVITGKGETMNDEEYEELADYQYAAKKYYLALYGSKAAIEQQLKKAGGNEKENMKAALEKTKTSSTYAQYLNSALDYGVTNTLTGFSATGEFIIGTPIKAAIDLFGGDSSVISGKQSRDALTSEAQSRMYEAAKAAGDENAIAGQLIANVVENLPNFAIAIYSAAAKAGTAIKEAGSIGGFLKNLSQNPIFWTSFCSTAGNDYESAIEGGANPTVAMLYALSTSALNAYIEIGGGIETLPKDLVGLKGGKAVLKEFITTSFEESGEEALQGGVTKLFSRIAYDRTPITAESVNEYVKQIAYESAMGFLGGAVLGGGQISFQTIANFKTAKEYKALGESLIASGQSDAVLKYALGSDMYSELAQEALSTKNAQTIGEIYTYVCRDIDTAINGAQNIEEAVEGIKAIASQEGGNNGNYAITQGVAMPQFIQKTADFGIDENTAADVLDAILDADQSRNINSDREIIQGDEQNEAAPQENDSDIFDEVENVNGESIFTEADKKEIYEGEEYSPTGESKSIIQGHIEKTAKRLNPDIKIKWDPEIETSGKWNPRTKTLTLNSNISLAEGYVEVFKHEFLHSLESKAEYNKFLNYLENKSAAFAKYAIGILRREDIQYTGGNKGAIQALFNYYYEMYTTDSRLYPVDRKSFTLEDAKREAAADFFAEVLFKGKEYRTDIAAALEQGIEMPEGDAETSLSALEELAQKDKNLFVRLWDMVKRFISNLKNHKTTGKLVADLERLEAKLKDVYNSAEVEAKENTAGGGVKYKINLDTDIEEKNIDNGSKCLDLMMKQAKTADNPESLVKRNAMFRSEIGQIDFVWGKPGSGPKFKGGYGFSHIIAKHGESTAQKAIETIAKATECSIQGNDNTDATQYRLRVYFDGCTAILSKSPETNHWLLTAWDNKEETAVYATGEVRDSLGATAVTPTLNRRSGVDTTVSNHSIRQNAEESQENFENIEKSSLGINRGNALRYNPEMFAKRLLRKSGSEADVDTVTEKLKKIITAHNKGGKTWDINSEGEYTKVSTVDGPVEELARYIASQIKTRITDDAQEVLRTLRKAKVYIDKRQAEEIRYKYKTLGNYRKSSSLNISPSASISLDSQWREWAEEFPGIFSADVSSTDMPEEFNRIVNSLKNQKEAYDYGGAEEYIAEQIHEVLDNSGPRAWQRNIGIAANAAAKEATAKERARGEAELNEYKTKVEARKEKEAASKRKRAYREKAVKLRDKFTKALENPKKNNHVPQQFIGAVKEALDIVYDNPIDYDDVQIDGKYYARLKKLNQDIQNTADEQTRKELIEQYNRLHRIATNAGDRVREIKQMLDALGKEKAYAETYKDPGDDKLFPVRKGIYDENISEMLEMLADELGETEAYNYNENQLRMIAEVFTALDKHISDYNKLVGVEERIEVSEAANEFMDEISRSHGNFKVLNGAIIAQMSPLRIFRMLGNYETGSVSEKLFEALNSGENKAIQYQMKAEEMIRREILGNPRLYKETREMFNIKKLVDSGLVDSNGKPVMVTRGMRLSLAMHGLNEQNRKAIKNGGVQVPKNLKKYYKKGAAASKKDVFRAKLPENTDALQWYSKLNESLSDIEKKWVGVLGKYYSEISAPALNEVTMQVFGFKKATVKNYWRIVHTEHFLDKPVDTVVKDSLLEHAGYLEKRKNSGKPIYLMDAIDQLENDINNHARYYGLVIPLSNFSKIYNFAQYDFDSSEWTGSVKEMIDDKYTGGKVTKYIENLLADLNGARHQELNWFDRLRGKYAQAVLSLNPRVAVKQTASYPTAAAVLGWKPITKALAVVEKESGDKRFVFARAELDEIKKYSPLLWYRMRGNMDAELGNIKDRGNVGDQLAKKMPALLGWIEKMDAGTVGRLWYASKYYVEDNFKLQKGSPEYYKKTAEIFEKVIEETQPNYSVMQRPAVLRSTNTLTRALTMFYTQRLQNANILFDSFMELSTKQKAYNSARGEAKATAAAELKEAWKKVFRAVSSQIVSNVLLNVMELAIRALISQMKPYRDDEKDEVTEAEIWQGLGSGVLDTMFGTVLFGSEIYEAISAAIGKGKFYGMQVPAVEEINDIVNVLISAFKFKNDTAESIKEGKFKAGEFAEDLTNKVFEALEKAFQPLTGIPIKNAKDLISGIVHQAMDGINGELFDYEAEVENNAYNRIVGAKARSGTQSYRILADSILNDDREKYEKELRRLTKGGAGADDIHKGVKAALKKSETVKAESEKLISKIEGSKTYKGLSAVGKDEVDSSTRDILAKEKMLSTGKDRSKKFSVLYDYHRQRNTAAYNSLKAQLKAEGLTDNEIKIGEEIAKFKFLESQGISISEWFTAKKSLSEQNAKKKIEEYRAISGMDFDGKTKSALMQNV